MKIPSLLAPIAVWLSYPAIFVLAGVILAMLMKLWRQPRNHGWPWLIIVAMLSIASWLCCLMLTVLPASRNAYLLHFWRDAFWPVWPIRIRTFTFPLFNFVEMFHRPVGLESGGLGLVLATVGAAWLWRNQRTFFMLLTIPLLAAMAASGLHMYPFAERLLLFAAPSAVLLLVLGLRTLWRQGSWARVVSMTSLVIILGLGSIRLVKMLPLGDIIGHLR